MICYRWLPLIHDWGSFYRYMYVPRGRPVDYSNPAENVSTGIAPMYCREAFRVEPSTSAAPELEQLDGCVTDVSMIEKAAMATQSATRFSPPESGLGAQRSSTDGKGDTSDGGVKEDRTIVLGVLLGVVAAAMVVLAVAVHMMRRRTSTSAYGNMDNSTA